MAIKQKAIIHELMLSQFDVAVNQDFCFTMDHVTITI